MEQQRHVVVVGGGISGLSAAYSLLRTAPRGTRITVVEASARAYLLDDRPLLARPRARRIFQDETMHQSLRAEAGMMLALSYVQGDNFAKAATLLEDPKVSKSHPIKPSFNS